MIQAAGRRFFGVFFPPSSSSVEFVDLAQQPLYRCGLRK